MTASTLPHRPDLCEPDCEVHPARTTTDAFERYMREQRARDLATYQLDVREDENWLGHELGGEA